jgi:hypothetical protein
MLPILGSHLMFPKNCPKNRPNPRSSCFLNPHFSIPHNPIALEQKNDVNPPEQLLYHSNTTETFAQNGCLNRSTAQVCAASGTHAVDGRSRGAYLLGVRGVGVGRVARGLEGLLQVRLCGGVAADPLRDVKPRRGHVGADGLVLPPRHGRSAAAQRGGAGDGRAMKNPRARGKGTAGMFGWFLTFSWAPGGFRILPWRYGKFSFFIRWEP